MTPAPGDIVRCSIGKLSPAWSEPRHEAGGRDDGVFLQWYLNDASVGLCIAVLAVPRISHGKWALILNEAGQMGWFDVSHLAWLSGEEM